MKNVRISFEKGEEIRYISHLDILRTFHRILRRSGLPIAYSEGFNPHPQTSFALPLSLGATGEREYIDLKLTEDFSKEEIIKMLNDAAPAGFTVKEAGEPALPFAGIERADYTVELLTERGEEDFEIIKNLLRKSEIIVSKKSKKGIKEVNIADMIHSYEVSLVEGNMVHFKLTVSAGSTVNLNPALVVSAFEAEGAQIKSSRVHRKGLYKEKAGDLLKNV